MDIDKIRQASVEGKKIGLVQGSWDLFHIGHLKYLLKAKELCDYLIVAMDSDEKIRKRKGPTRPIWPEEERYEFIKLLKIADQVIIKPIDSPKWDLIKKVRPDVLIAIKENYSDEEIEALSEFCGYIAVLPRQARTSTSDKIRQIVISSNVRVSPELLASVKQTVKGISERWSGSGATRISPIPELLEALEQSTDDVCPTAVAYELNGEWVIGTNQIDFTIPDADMAKRTELFYNTVEHAEINLLKKLKLDQLDGPIICTLFPCDKCMKVLIDKGVKEIYYLEDHQDRNWSKRSHELANKNGIKTVCLMDNHDEEQSKNQDNQEN